MQQMPPKYDNDTKVWNWPLSRRQNVECDIALPVALALWFYANLTAKGQGHKVALHLKSAWHKEYIYEIWIPCPVYTKT